jgi:hypothetical protein
MKFEFDISFRGMDEEVNDSLYRVHFPPYTHFLYEPPEPQSQAAMMLDSLVFDGPLIMSYCGSMYWKSIYGVFEGKDKLDPATLVDDPEDITCPTCIERFVFSTLGSLP